MRAPSGLSFGQLKQLRRLLDAAGSKAALVREVGRAARLPRRKRGRPRAGDAKFLAVLEVLCRDAERSGISRNALLTFVAHQVNGDLGKNPQAAARRIATKLRKAKFDEAQLQALAERVGHAPRGYPKDEVLKFKSILQRATGRKTRAVAR
jgi:hypothetical protein